MSGTPWMDWMASHLGEPEKTGAPATDFDKEVFSHTNTDLEDGVMLPGCAATVCAALEETGYKSPHSAQAISFKGYGDSCQLTPGCIVVFEWPSGGHHVSFCKEVLGDYVACLGGNQTSEVKVSTYSRQYIKATRWPVI